MDGRWETFDHTADLGLSVEAPTPEALYALAARAVLAQVAEVAEPDAAPEEERAEVRIEGEDAADLLVEWLNRALLEAELASAVWTRVTIDRLGPRTLAARLAGPRRDRARMVFLREVKAVSHHGLELDLTPGRCRCRFVIDL